MITRSLAMMIAKDLQPLTMLEDEGFKNFMKTMDPNYKIPSSKSLMDGMITNLYAECHHKVNRSMLAIGNVVLTTDMWTSRATEAYLSITAHFVDDDWKKQSYVLETTCLLGQQTSDSIGVEIKRMTDEWDITAKVHAIVTDNSPDMIAAVEKAGFAHFPSFAHTLNWVVIDAINSTPDLLPILQKCSNIVSYFNHSTTAADQLQELQKQLKIAERKLVRSVETQWTSVYYMLERMQEQKEAINNALSQLGETSLFMDEQEWVMVNFTIKALAPFEEASKELTSGKYVLASKVIPLVKQLIKVLSASDIQNENALVKKLTANCERRFCEIESFYDMAVSTFLDLRFKDIGFHDRANVESMKEKLTAEMQTVSQASTISVTLSAQEPSEPSIVLVINDPILSTGVAVASKSGIWAEFDDEVVTSQKSYSPSNDITIEFRRFAEEKVIPRGQDPITWWRNHEQTFPLLSKLGRKYLAIVASSVPAERIFLKTGELISQRRSRMKGKIANRILFLNQNL